MARVDLRNDANASGDWFVDTRCIDCGTCRGIAPALFGPHRGHSVVRRAAVRGERPGRRRTGLRSALRSVGSEGDHE